MPTQYEIEQAKKKEAAAREAKRIQQENRREVLEEARRREAMGNRGSVDAAKEVERFEMQDESGAKRTSFGQFDMPKKKK